MAGLSGDVRDPDRGEDCQRHGCCFLREEGAGMMEETGNGRGLVTLHHRQEGGRQTRVGAGREKKSDSSLVETPTCCCCHVAESSVCCRCCGVVSSVRCCCGVDKEEPEEPDGVRSRIQGVGNAPHQALDAAEVLLLGGARWVHVVVASFCHGYGVWQTGGRSRSRTRNTGN